MAPTRKNSKNNNPLNLLNKEDNQEVYYNPPNIYITRNTIKFGDNVYQFKNVTGFGISELKKNDLYLKIAIILLLSWLSIVFFPEIPGGFKFIHLVLTVVAFYIYGKQATYYALALYLPSGDNKMFVSSDVTGLRKMIDTLYEYMENPNIEGGFIFKIDKSHTSIDQSNSSFGVGYAENIQ